MSETTKSGPQPEDTDPQDAALAGERNVTLRQFPFWRRIQIPIIAAGGFALIRSIGPTLRIEKLGFEHVKGLFAEGQPCILCFWHRAIFPILWFTRGRPVAILSSANFDGQWAGRITQALGLKVAVGSSSRGGLGALWALEDWLARRYHAAFAVDGPRGPRFVAKRGPVFLARRTGCPIVCMHAFSERAFNLKKTWDQSQLSYPFSRVALVFSAPIWVPGDADADALNHKYAEMQRRLELARDAAESWFTRSPAEQERDRALLNGPGDFGLPG